MVDGAVTKLPARKAASGEPKVAAPKAKRPRWTPEHRKNLSEAIKAKWREPEYRQKIIAHMRDPSCQDKRIESRRVRPMLKPVPKGPQCSCVCLLPRPPAQTRWRKRDPFHENKSPLAPLPFHQCWS